MIDGEQDSHVTEQSEQTSQVEQSETQSTEHGGADQEKPANGYEGDNFVEFTPEQQKRLNQLAKKAGSAERESAELRKIAKEQYDVINELRNGQQQIVTHLQTTNYAEAESQLKVQKKAAFDKGDFDTYESIGEKLAELKIQKALAAKAPAPQVVRQPGRPVSGNDVVEMAVNEGSITRNDAEAYKAWASEADAYGNPLRPWVNETDMRNTAAAIEGRAVFANPAYQNKSFADKLKEIDKRMGMQNKVTGQGVMPAGNLTGSVKTSNVKLTPFQENIAVRTKFAGSGKSRNDHIEAYRKQVADVRSSKR